MQENLIIKSKYFYVKSEPNAWMGIPVIFGSKRRLFMDLRMAMVIFVHKGILAHFKKGL